MSTGEDKFVAMVSAKAEVDLPISQFEPRTMLKRALHPVKKARFAAIDYHNHLDSLEPKDVLAVMDECGIEHVVNITMQTGNDALVMIKKYRDASAQRFSTIGWMDWKGSEQPGFFARAVEDLERLVEHGAIGIKFWKDLGLSVRDSHGELLRVDDERLAPLFEKAGELCIPVMFHTADPFAFFEPIDRFNERYEELAAHPDWAFSDSQYSKYELLEQRNTVFGRHPNTQFVGAHIGECAEDMAFVCSMLEAYPNVMVDISARANELGRQPYTARNFFLKYSDRILFGTDLLPEVEMYRRYFQFLETADEYIEYPTHASGQGRWNIYGLYLPDEVLRKVYRENALKLLPHLAG